MKRAPITRRQFLRSAAIGAGSLVLAACQPKVVEKIVEQTVPAKEVEKLVTAVPAAPARLSARTSARCE